MPIRILVTMTMMLTTAPSLPAATLYYVSPHGNDNNSGTLQEPFASIQRAADVLQPGDTVLIREGVYREKIIPRRGGLSEEARITYRAYPGERPVIKGSEPITNWSHQGGGVWRVELPNGFFGDYNPYQLTFADASRIDWLHTTDVRPGEVFLDGRPMRGRKSPEAVARENFTWHSEGDGQTTRIFANFGTADPNVALAEITVRPQLFKPNEIGLGFITLDGLTFTQSATQWVEPGAYQDGMLSTFWGRFWIIENCHISHSKTVGIVSGHPGIDLEGFTSWRRPSGHEDPLASGNHIVRNNLLQYCGTNGIAGQWGWNRSIIENNIIEHTNSQANISGIELAGIKIHYASDITIRNNIIRYNHVGPSGHGQAHGIWLDYEGQGNRITGNVIYGMENTTASIYIEMCHGPNLIDNNIIVGRSILYHSSRVVSAHNLLVDASHSFGIQRGRRSAWFEPQTREPLGRGEIDLKGFRIHNDIYINPARRIVAETPDVIAGPNVYYNAAAPFTYESDSVGSEYAAAFRMVERPDGVEIWIDIDATPGQLSTPLITHDFIGVYELMSQGIEDRDGQPISIDHDAQGIEREGPHPVAGPFETLKAGINRYVFVAGPQVEVDDEDVSAGWRQDSSAPAKPHQAEGGITYQRWDDVAGESILDLTDDPRFPDTPSSIRRLHAFAADVNAGERYGGRIVGHLVPPETGTYHLFISADAMGELWLSSDEHSQNARRIAFTGDWTMPGEWTKHPSQKSPGLHLVAGRQYYIEARMVNAAFGSNLMVGWTRPSDPNSLFAREVIPGGVLSPLAQ